MFPTKVLMEAISMPFKRSQEGLFHGKTKLYGNNVPFSKKKTRRSWLPNIQSTRLWSEAFGRNMRVSVTVRALRTIKKLGGLDKYVLQTKPELLKDEGMRLRVMIREKLQKSEWMAINGPWVPPPPVEEPDVDETVVAAATTSAELLEVVPVKMVLPKPLRKWGEKRVLDMQKRREAFPEYSPRNNHAPPCTTMERPGLGMVRKVKKVDVKKKK